VNLSSLNPQTLLIFMSALAFSLGFITFIVGVFILAYRTTNTDVQSLAVQTTKLVQKGLAEDMAGLVGQTSELMNGMNQMVRTAQGVGIFLIILGILLMAAASWLALQIQ
jgi:uncharacterized membrane protein